MKPIGRSPRSLWQHLARLRDQKVGRVEGRDRRIVRKIVGAGETEEFIQRMREKHSTLADHALAAIRHALEVKRRR